jgi:hypothetical protein
LTASFKQVCIKSFKPGSVLVDSLISLTNSFNTELAETLILSGLTNQANISSSLNVSTKSITASYGNYILIMSLFFLFLIILFLVSGSSTKSSVCLKTFFMILTINFVF